MIGSLRRECLDHVIALSERQLLRVVRNYVVYYNRTRTHLSFGKDPPDERLRPYLIEAVERGMSPYLHAGDGKETSCRNVFLGDANGDNLLADAK